MSKLSTYLVPSWARALTLQPKTRLALGQLPTPLIAWQPPGLPTEGTYWLKRDDLSGIALSGNKIRKLEFLLADAVEQQADIVLTCGGIQSNHCRATAVASRQLGLDSVLFLRTANPDDEPGLSGNLLLHRLTGSEIQLITPEQYRQRQSLMERHAETLRAEGRRPYIIPEGGSNALGSWGYIEAVRELATQLAATGTEIDDLVFACGSGGTAAGLAIGVKLSGLSTRVHAINVCDDADYFYAHVDLVLKELGASYEAREILDIIDGYKGLGYAISQPKELEYIVDIAKTTGFLFDPVYSGKAMFGLKHELQARPERFQGKRILFIHTGGIFGLYEKIDQLMQCLPSKASHFQG